MVATTFGGGHPSAAVCGLVARKGIAAQLDLVGSCVGGIAHGFSFSHDTGGARSILRPHVQLFEIAMAEPAAFLRGFKACLSGCSELLHPGLGHAGDGEYHHRFAGKRSRKDACCS